MLSSPSAAANPFFRMAPHWALWLFVLLATAATVIASQALISGAFSLTMQAVQMGYLPRIQVMHTSDKESGQIYIPRVNVLLADRMRYVGRGFRRQLSLGFRLRDRSNLDDVDHNGTVLLDGKPGVALEHRFYDSSLHTSGSCRSLILRVERT